MVFPSGGWLSHGAPRPQGALFFVMLKKPLSKTNPYLKNDAQRKAMLYTSVVTSSAIEGVKLPDMNAGKSLQRRSKCPK
jgi:hypothetical protein